MRDGVPEILDIPHVIATRRDGLRHSEQELRALALAAARNEIPDYQLAAWLMAAYLNPLDANETTWLTLGMAASGERLDLTGLPKPWVDKHSTGGVGDKTHDRAPAAPRSLRALDYKDERPRVGNNRRHVG